MFKKILLYTSKLEEILSVTTFFVLITLCALQIAFRFMLNFSLGWTEELARFTFIILVYVACSLGIQKGAHVRVEIIDIFVTGTPRYILNQILDLIWAGFVFLIGYSAIEIVQDSLAIGKTSPALDWQFGWMYAVIPITFVLMSLRLIQRMVTRHQLWFKKREHL